MKPKLITRLFQRFHAHKVALAALKEQISRAEWETVVAQRRADDFERRLHSIAKGEVTRNHEHGTLRMQLEIDPDAVDLARSGDVVYKELMHQLTTSLLKELSKR